MILMMDSVGWFNNLLRPLFGGIDFLIYSIVGWTVEGIFNLSFLTASEKVTKVIYNRIYVILALFMVFKLSFSFLQYVISPDAMTDKEKGVGKLIARTITMVAILILLPIFFFSADLFPGQNAPVLSMLQNGVIKTLPKVILGISDDTGQLQNSAKENGNAMALNMLTSLYYPNECKDSTTCETQLNDLSSFTSSLTVADGQVYMYYYMWPLTTICGIALILILGGIALDVATRTFKLMILQMIAPIPVMSYIDPKSSKDGAFNSWIKTFVSTYIDIFVKIASVYLLLLLIRELFNNNLFGDYRKNMGFNAANFVTVFLVIGLFKFAKEIPKFIKDALGIKAGGGGSFMDSMKSLAGAAGAVGGAAIGAAGGLAGGATSGYAAARAAGNNKFTSALKGVGKGLGGLVPGLARGGYQGGKGAAKGNVFAGLGGAVASQAAINQRKAEAAAGGSTFFGRTAARASELFTGQTPADRDKEKVERYKEKIGDVDAFKSVLADSAGKSDAIINGTNLKQFKADLEAAKSGDNDALSRLKNYGFSKKLTTTNAAGVTTTTYVGDLSAAIAGANKFEKDWQKAYYVNVMNGVITDSDATAVISAKSVADAGIEDLGLTDDSGVLIQEVTASNAGEVIGKAKNESNRIVSRKKYRSNQANAAAIKRK